MTHLEQIQRAVDFIEDHLGDELETAAIAKEAGFSMWHFQMVFRSAVGDTLKEYVRKRRLSKALQRVGQTDDRLIDIAIEAGFESQESFTRAFKQMFGQTPGEVRKDGIEPFAWLKRPRITYEYLDHLYGGITMEPRIETVQEMKIVGLGADFISILSTDKTNHVVIPKLWDEYMKRAGEIKARTSWVDFGVCTRASKENTHPHACYYIAGAEVSVASETPEGMQEAVIPMGRYAVFIHKGKLDKLDHTMRYIYGSWLPKSGMKLRDAPDLERYDQRFKMDSDESELDIYIPVV